MNGKRLLLLVLTALLVISAAGCGHGTDIVGVTTLPKKNIVIMNSRTGTEFVTGSGTVTVKQGEHIHLEYALSAGSFDLAFHAGDARLDVFERADLENLTTEGEVFGKSGIAGTGSLDFEAQPGEYTVYFALHEAVGTARVSAKKG